MRIHKYEVAGEEATGQPLPHHSPPRSILCGNHLHNSCALPYPSSHGNQHTSTIFPSFPTYTQTDLSFCIHHPPLTPTDHYHFICIHPTSPPTIYPHTIFSSYSTTCLMIFSPKLFSLLLSVYSVKLSLSLVLFLSLSPCVCAYVLVYVCVYYFLPKLSNSLSLPLSLPLSLSLSLSLSL
ncbi:unnamed protein product [Acanthosepion pharaonis]|uniref:Uncharacterized protein n=1 Tax=Acanthosepion pharaonis TaxID=158019 RepID=A0A812BK61_ACAPH|nr:unnamed protein product [Sepia pharaonis]